MTNIQVIDRLQKEIYNKIVPLIGSKTILLDCPYHTNIGDILIWKGECMFLDAIARTPISQSSLFTFDFKEIGHDVTICLHGGGNFGDLYRTAQDFRIKVIQSYPNNRIIIFPQSVWYEDKSLIESDAELFSKHKDLFICARDIASYEFLKNNFKDNNILLVPDMAFYIGDLSKQIGKTATNTNKTLYLKRRDAEFVEGRNIDLSAIQDVKDWPGFESRYDIANAFKGVGMRLNKLGPIWKKVYAKPMDIIMQKCLMRRLVKNGIDLLSPYDTIYTTRLHAMILGILLDKSIFIIDNKTKKLSDFYNAWLKDYDKIQLITD